MDDATDSGNASKDTSAARKPAKKNLELAHKFYSLPDQQRFEKLDSLFTADHEMYFQSSGVPTTVSDMIPFAKMFSSTFPDYRHHFGRTVEDKNMVSIHMRYTGTHKNKVMEIEATRKQVDYVAIGGLEIKEGNMDRASILEYEKISMKQY